VLSEKGVSVMGLSMGRWWGRWPGDVQGLPRGRYAVGAQLRPGTEVGRGSPRPLSGSARYSNYLTTNIRSNPMTMVNVNNSRHDWPRSWLNAKVVFKCLNAFYTKNGTITMPGGPLPFYSR